MTDYQSAGWIGNIAGPTWHQLDADPDHEHHALGAVVPARLLFVPYILCIIFLTVMVRGMMFPVSRKQAMTSMRMQELAPEMKKLQEKYKDDRQALAAAQMELYRKHGVNPFGTCWLLLLQMPIFMGLYYALQESILFRLAPFGRRGSRIWRRRTCCSSGANTSRSSASRTPTAGSLPGAVSEPPADDRGGADDGAAEDDDAAADGRAAGMQQKMMKYMMVFMGLMFYKVAAGLCLYFIASSLWGFAERQLLPKKKPARRRRAPPRQAGRHAARRSAPGGRHTAPSVDDRRVGEGGQSSRQVSRRAARRQGQARQAPAGQPRGAVRADGSAGRCCEQRLRDWWADMLEQAGKK